MNMPKQPLTRHPARSRRTTQLAEDLAFCHGRVHEICGPARRALAVRLMAAREGPVLWFAPTWMRERLAAQGLAPWMNPGRIVFAGTAREDDLYWGLEEALRSGAAPVVVAEVTQPPALTPVRRLHLAAEAGGSDALMLLLTPEHGGAQGVETRWHMAPAHEQAEDRRWLLTRLRDRMAPPKSFELGERAPGQMKMEACTGEERIALLA